MRFLADMGIASDVTDALRVVGHDAVHLRDRGLGRLSDAEILNLALHDRRIILTHDLDFSRLLALSGAGEPSVITFRLSNMTPTSVLPRLFLALSTFKGELARGCAISVTDGAQRCRDLPMLGSGEQEKQDGTDVPGAR